MYMAVHQQLYFPQDWVLGIDDDKNKITTLCFKEPTKQSYTSITQTHSPLFMDISLSLVSELEKQRSEMDCFLHFQSEKLRTILRDETSRQHVLLLQRYESRLKSLMKEKDDELTVATNRAMELQSCLVRAEMEAEAWQKIAMENEAMVLNLNNELNQMREKMKQDHYALSIINGAAAEDAESVCDREDRQGEYNNKKLACKLCHVRSSCVVFLPCRHLSSCQSCEGLLGFCPVCGSVKKASLEAFLV